MADSGTHLLHTRNWRPDSLGHTDRNKQKGRNIGPLLETDHHSKWDLKVAAYLCPPPAPIQLFYASPAPSPALPIILRTANLQTADINIFQLKSHFITKARTQHSEGYFRVDACAKLALLLNAGFPIFKICIPWYAMRTLWLSSTVCVDSRKHTAFIDLYTQETAHMYEKLVEMGEGCVS